MWIPVITLQNDLAQAIGLLRLFIRITRLCPASLNANELLRKQVVGADGHLEILEIHLAQ